jgi:hypothetical protein
MYVKKGIVGSNYSVEKLLGRSLIPAVAANHWELLLPPRGWWWKGGPFSYVTKATSGSAVRCCVVPGHQYWLNESVTLGHAYCVLRPVPEALGTCTAQPGRKSHKLYKASTPIECKSTWTLEQSQTSCCVYCGRTTRKKKKKRRRYHGTFFEIFCGFQV